MRCVHTVDKDPETAIGDLQALTSPMLPPPSVPPASLLAGGHSGRRTHIDGNPERDRSGPVDPPRRVQRAPTRGGSSGIARGERG
jgi:hypothetical protein